jgi:hypothetical protein
MVDDLVGKRASLPEGAEGKQTRFSYLEVEWMF